VPFGTDRSNLQLVEAAVERITSMGASPAAVADVRTALTVEV
jgi:uncharacterized protein (DUF849 family)